MNDDPHPANRCHQCGAVMKAYRPPEPGSPGAGICPEHGVSYDKCYVGPGSIFSE